MFTSSIITFLVSLFFLGILLVSSNYIGFISEKPSTSVRKVHKKTMIKIGGVTFLSIYPVLFFINIVEITWILIFSIIFMIIGLVSDLNNKFSARSRLLLFSIVTISYLIFSGNYIDKIDNEMLSNTLFKFDLFIILFSILSIILFVNATNIIDGLHGLKTGTIIIIISMFIYIIPKYEIELIWFMYTLLITTGCFFIVNFFGGRIRSGDTGSYFLGFIVGAIAIHLNNNDIIHSFHVACILLYPVFETIFSWLRRIIDGTSPFQPDQLHLHSLIYNFFEKNNYSYLNSEKKNQLSSIIILLLQLLFNFLVISLASETPHFIIAILTFIIIYIVIYSYLSKRTG